MCGENQCIENVAIAVWFSKSWKCH